MRRKAGLALVLYAGMTFAAVASELHRAPLGDSPVTGGGVFTTGGGISVAVEPREIAGAPYLCGVWARSEVLSAYVADQVGRVLTRGVVQAGEITLLRDFRQFAQVAAAPSYAGADAKCVPVARSGAPLRVHFPDMPLVRDKGDGVFVRADFVESAQDNPAVTRGSLQAWLRDWLDRTSE